MSTAQKLYDAYIKAADDKKAEAKTILLVELNKGKTDNLLSDVSTEDQLKEAVAVMVKAEADKAAAEKAAAEKAAAEKAAAEKAAAEKAAAEKAAADAKAKELSDKRKKALEEAKKKAEKEEREKALEERKKTAKALYVQVKDRMEKAGTLPKMQIKTEYKEKDEKKPIKEMAKEADMKMYETKDGTVIMYNGASVGGALKTSYAYSQAANCWVQIKSKEDTTKDEEMKLNNAKIDSYNDGLKTGMGRTEEAHKEACGIMLLSYHEALEKAEKELADLKENYECIKIPVPPTECELLEAEIIRLQVELDAKPPEVIKVVIKEVEKEKIVEKEVEKKVIQEVIKEVEKETIVEKTVDRYIAKPMLNVSHLKTCFVNVECASDLREGLVTVMLIPCDIIEKYFKLLRPPCRLENFINTIVSDHETDGICISSHHYAHAEEEEEEEEIKHHHHIEVIPGVLKNDLGITEKDYDIGYKNDVGYQVLVLAKRDKTSYADIDTTVDGIQNYETHEFVCDKQFNCVAPPPPTITYSCSLEPCLEKGFHNYYDERINVIYKALIFSDNDISELKKIKKEEEMNTILSSHNPLLRAYNDLIQLGEPDYWSKDVDGGRNLFEEIYTRLNDLIEKMYSFWKLVGDVGNNEILQLKKKQFEELEALKYGDDKLWAHYRNLAAADYFSKNMMIISKISGFDESLVDWLDMWKTIKDNDLSMSGDRYNELVGFATDFTSSVDEFIGMDTPQKFTDKAIKHLLESVIPKAKAWNDELVKENYTSKMITVINKGTNDMAMLPQPGDYDNVLIAPHIQEVLTGTITELPESQDSKAKDSLEDKINKLTEENIKVEEELQEAIDDHEDFRLEEEYKAYTLQQALSSTPAKPKEEWEKERKKVLTITSVDADGNYELNINAKMNKGSVNIITVPASIYAAEYDALINAGDLRGVLEKITLSHKAHKIGIEYIPEQTKGKVPTGIDAFTAVVWNDFTITNAYAVVEHEYTVAERAGMIVIVMYTNNGNLYSNELTNIVLVAQPVVINGLKEAAEGGEAAVEEEEQVVVEEENDEANRISTRNAEPLSALEECLQSLKELKEGLEKQEPETEEEKMLKELQELKIQLANVN
jgi:hypothetical protein